MSNNFEFGEKPENINTDRSEVIPAGNRWLNMLNKITSVIVTGLSHNNQPKIIVISGVETGVGATTIGTFMTRLLSSYNTQEQALFVSMDTHDHSAEQEFTVFDSMLLGNVDAVDMAIEASRNALREIRISMSAELSTTPSIPRPMEQFLDALQQYYHWIVIVIPSRPDSTLLQAFARKADGVVVVARADVTRKASLEAIVHEIEVVNGNFLGTILNFRRYPLPNWLTNLL